MILEYHGRIAGVFDVLLFVGGRDRRYKSVDIRHIESPGISPWCVFRAIVTTHSV